MVRLLKTGQEYNAKPKNTFVLIEGDTYETRQMEFDLMGNHPHRGVYPCV